MDGFQYTNGNLDFFPMAEGYVKVLSGFGISAYKYVFNYVDHLGNVRLSYSDSDLNEAINPATEIIEESNYYPFGLEQKGYNNVVSSNGNSVASKFKYNGIELEESLGLNLYEMDFRSYDPAIARFTSVDPVTHFSYSTYSAFDNNPVFWTDPSGADTTLSGLDAQTYFGRLKDYIASKPKEEENDDWVEKADGTVSWDNNATSQATTKTGETYLGKNVLVGTHNRDATGYEEINTAQFDLYLESDKTGPTATIMGNTVPSDITKSGTLAEGLYSAKFGHRNREKYHNELAIRIYNLDGSDGLPTVNGNPSKANSDLLTGVLFHMGNNYQTSLFDSRGNAYSHGCQTSGCFPHSRPVHNAFMNKVGRDFKGTYYLRSKPILTVPPNQENNK